MTASAQSSKQPHPYPKTSGEALGTIVPSKDQYSSWPGIHNHIVKNHFDTKVHLHAFIMPILTILNDAKKINIFSWLSTINKIGHIGFGYNCCFNNWKRWARLWKLTSSWFSNHTSAYRWNSFRTTYGERKRSLIEKSKVKQRKYTGTDRRTTVAYATWHIFSSFIFS